MNPLPLLRGKSVGVKLVALDGRPYEVMASRVKLLLGKRWRTIKASCLMERPGDLVNLHRLGLSGVVLSARIADGTIQETMVRASSWGAKIRAATRKEAVTFSFWCTERMDPTEEKPA